MKSKPASYNNQNNFMFITNISNVLTLVKHFISNFYYKIRKYFIIVMAVFLYHWIAKKRYIYVLLALTENLKNMTKKMSTMGFEPATLPLTDTRSPRGRGPTSCSFLCFGIDCVDGLGR